MTQFIDTVTLLVRDNAIRFYTDTLGFSLVQDTQLSAEKRWVVVKPPNGKPKLLLSKASTEEQMRLVGNQTGGRVFMVLCTDNFERDYIKYRENGVIFKEEPRIEPHGKVVVMKDLYGNLFDLIEVH